MSPAPDKAPRGAPGAPGDGGAAPPWKVVQPAGWAPPVGYANAVVSTGTKRVALAGQTAMGPDGKVRHPGDLPAQAALAFENVKTVLAAAGARPEHLVRVRIYVVSAQAYATYAHEIGKAWRAAFGRWYPAMTLVEVPRLYDPEALIEVEGDAELP